MKLFLLILIINGLLVLIYLVWNLIIRRKEKTLSTWMKAAVMLLCPAVGPLFVFLSFWLYKLVMSQNMDLSDVVFGKEKTEAFIWPDEEVERNMISIEDALEITDKKSLRTFIMNVIRGDYRNSLSSIALALNSEDSETAHTRRRSSRMSSASSVPMCRKNMPDVRWKMRTRRKTASGSWNTWGRSSSRRFSRISSSIR